MRTAEEILDEFITMGLSGASQKMRLLSDKSIEIEAMKAYAKEACAAQREICVDNYLNKGGDTSLVILNSPEPNLE